jgi:hypothetical protein
MMVDKFGKKLRVGDCVLYYHIVSPQTHPQLVISRICDIENGADHSEIDFATISYEMPDGSGRIFPLFRDSLGIEKVSKNKKNQNKVLFLRKLEQ